MKAVLSLLSLVATLSLAQAGGFGGPPPFTNGSPLTSGTNGSYQASVRGSNLSGVVSFSFASGTQSGGSFVIFYQGEVFTGLTDVAIMDGDMTGVLDGFNIPSSGSFTETVTGGGTITESISINPLTAVSGYFNAELDNDSPTGSFSGDGEVSYLVQVETFTEDTNTGEGSESSYTEAVTADFKIKGVRVSVPTS